MLQPNTTFLLLRSAESFIFRMIFAATMIYMVGVGLDPLQLVLVGTCLELAVLVFEVPTGIVADRVSRRLSVIIGFAITGVAYLLMGLIPRFGIIVAASALWGIGYTFTSGAVEAWIVDEVGQVNAEPLFPRSRKIAALTGIAGTISGVGLGMIRIEIPILLGGVLFCVLSVLLRFLMHEEGFIPLGESSATEPRNGLIGMLDTARAGIGVIGGVPLLVALIVAELLFGGHSEGYDRLRDAHMIRNIGLPGVLPPVVWIGGLGLVVGLLVSAGNAVTEGLTPRLRHPGLPLAALTMTAAVAIGLFAFSESFVLAAAALVIVGTTRGIADPIVSIWVNRYIPSRVRATVLSMWGQADAAGQILLGPLIGLLGRSTRTGIALAVSGLLLLPVVGVYLGAALDRRQVRRR